MGLIKALTEMESIGGTGNGQGWVEGTPHTDTGTPQPRAHLRGLPRPMELNYASEGGTGCDGSLWMRLRLLLCMEEDKEWKRPHIATLPRRAQWKCHPPSCETETSYDLAEG